MRTRSRIRRRISELLSEVLPYPQSEVYTDKVLDLTHPEVSVTEQQAMVGALSHVTGLHAALNGGRLGTLATSLLKARFTSQQILEWYEPIESSLWGQDWRSRQKGARGVQLVNEKQLRETIGAFAKSAEAEAVIRVESYDH
jgi:hypothetical protein